MQQPCRQLSPGPEIKIPDSQCVTDGDVKKETADWKTNGASSICSIHLPIFSGDCIPLPMCILFSWKVWTRYSATLREFKAESHHRVSDVCIHRKILCEPGFRNFGLKRIADASCASSTVASPTGEHQAIFVEPFCHVCAWRNFYGKQILNVVRLLGA